MPAWQDRSNAGAHRALTNFQFSFAANQRRVPDFDACHISDRLQLSRFPFKWNSQVACANCFAFNSRCRWRMLDRLARKGSESDQNREQEREDWLGCGPSGHAENVQRSTFNAQRSIRNL